MVNLKLCLWNFGLLQDNNGESLLQEKVPQFFFLFFGRYSPGRFCNRLDYKLGSSQTFSLDQRFSDFNLKEDLNTGLDQNAWSLTRIMETANNHYIASSLRTGICIDYASNKSSFRRPFSHFARVLVDLDLTKVLSYKILVERVGFALFFLGYRI